MIQVYDLEGNYENDATSPVISWDDLFYFGGDYAGYDYFQGMLTEVKIWQEYITIEKIRGFQYG